jgi:hypothetical protein
VKVDDFGAIWEAVNIIFRATAGATEGLRKFCLYEIKIWESTLKQSCELALSLRR